MLLQPQPAAQRQPTPKQPAQGTAVSPGHRVHGWHLHSWLQGEKLFTVLMGPMLHVSTEEAQGEIGVDGAAFKCGTWLNSESDAETPSKRDSRGTHAGISKPG